VDPSAREILLHVHGTSVVPNELRVTFEPISEETWDQALARMSAKARYPASLLLGELPSDVERIFQEEGSELFPVRKQVKLKCDCGIIHGECPHQPDALRAIAQAVDRDPFLLFELRGRSATSLLQALHVASEHSPLRPEETVEVKRDGDDEVPAGKAFRRFSNPVGELHFHIAAPEAPLALLRRLGDPAGWRAERPLAEVLGPSVQLAAGKARDIALGDDDAQS
jgi:uncharacterized Zn finger protein